MAAHTTRLAYRVSELADALGVSTRAVHNWISDGSIRAARIGRAVLVPADEVDRLLGAVPQSNSSVPAA